MFTRTTRAKRNIATVALAALVGSLLALSSPAGAGPDTNAAASERLSGANRYATAAAIAQDDGWGAVGAAQDITIVNGENFPDGLAAAGLGDRILLVRSDSVPAETEAAIKALEALNTGDGVGQITIVGGTSVVSDAVYIALDALNGDQTVRRLSGADRYATALAVAEDVDATPVDVVLATGENFPDALAAGPLALDNDAPLILNQGSSLLPAVRDYIVKASGTIYVVGGEGVVPASIVTELTAMGKAVERISGADREGTAVAIAAEIAADGGGLTGNESAILVNRNSFADALAAAPFAHQALVDGSIMLTDVDSIPTATATWHVDNCDTIGVTTTATQAAVYAMGGSAVISDATLAAAAAATACAAVSFTATVANSDFKQAVYELNCNATPGNGITLTAVAGSAADGANGSGWDITVTDGASASAVVDLTNKTMTVSLVVPATPVGASFGLTQQQYVDAWNTLGGDATKYFTPAVTTATGNPSGYNDGHAACQNTNADSNLHTVAETVGSQDQTVVLTFNQDVDDDAATNAGVVLTTADLNTSVGTIDAVVTPLVGTPGGASVYTILLDDETDAAQILVAGTGTVNAVAGQVFSTKSGVAAAATAVTLTAAS